MKSILILLFFFVGSSLHAQEADVANTVESLKQALIDGKKELLEKIAHEDLTYGHSSGLIENKKEFVEALVSEKSDFVSITLEEQTIKVTGNTATVRHKMTGETVNNGTQSTLNLKVLLVFVKVGKEWKLLARQAVKIAV